MLGLPNWLVCGGRSLCLGLLISVFAHLYIIMIIQYISYLSLLINLCVCVIGGERTVCALG